MMAIDLLSLSTMTPLFLLAFIVVIAWSLVWKGIALWHAARNSQKGWFIAMLIVNTVGILEIIYLCCFQKKKKRG